MIRIGVIGDIGSGKSHVAKLFGYPVFNADLEVAKLYKNSKKCYFKIKKRLPNYITSFPIKKSKLSEAIMDNQNNLKKIIKIIHPEVRKKMNRFLYKNRNKKFVILDIPLIIENKINKRDDILIFVEKFRKLQLSLEIKKKKSNFVIKNNFKNLSVKKNVKKIMEKVLLNARSYT